MRDLDLLVPLDKIVPASQLLSRLNYLQIEKQGGREVKHVPAFTREIESVLIVVELHYDLFDGFWNRCCTWKDLNPERLSFKLGSVAAYSMAPKQLMWHIWLHLLEEEQLRLIWIADLVGCAETYVDSLCWEEMRKASGGLVTLLELLAPAIPLSDRIRAELRPRDFFPETPESLQLKGWPRTSHSTCRGSTLRFIAWSLSPSRACLAIRYGEMGWAPRILNRVVFTRFNS